MVGVRVPLLVVAVGDDHLRPLAADDRNQPAHGLVEVSVGEGAGILVLGCIGHARVAVAQHDDLVVADEIGGPGQLLHADVVQTLSDLRPVHRRVEDVARFAAGTAHQHGVHAFVVVLVHGCGPLRRLVVGVGVHGQ